MFRISSRDSHFPMRMRIRSEKSCGYPRMRIRISELSLVLRMPKWLWLGDTRAPLFHFAHINMNYSTALQFFDRKHLKWIHLFITSRKINCLSKILCTFASTHKEYTIQYIDCLQFYNNKECSRPMLYFLFQMKIHLNLSRIQIKCYIHPAPCNWNIV